MSWFPPCSEMHSHTADLGLPPPCLSVGLPPDVLGLPSPCSSMRAFTHCSSKPAHAPQWRSPAAQHLLWLQHLSCLHLGLCALLHEALQLAVVGVGSLACPVSQACPPCAKHSFLKYGIYGALSTERVDPSAGFQGYDILDV